MGAVTWNLSLGLYEMAHLGREPWWWRLRQGLRHEFRDLDPNQMVLRLRGPRDIGSLAYGETPALSVLKVLDSLELPPHSTLVDLGSGRGLPCLTAAAGRGIRAIGFEYFAVYTERCQRLADRWGWSARFLSGNFLRQTWPEAQLYWVSASAFPDDLRTQLQQRLTQVSPQAWVVTQDWLLDPPFQCVRMQQLPVSWGIAKMCYHRLAE